MSYQKIIISGNLGRDPEMRYTPAGKAITNFTIAVNESFTDKNGEKIKRTIWFRVTAWEKQAEICNQYLKKGSYVIVDGKLNADPETGNPKIFTKKDGNAGSSFEITADTVRFISTKENTTNPPTNQPNEMNALPPEEDIPF